MTAAEPAVASRVPCGVGAPKASALLVTGTSGFIGEPTLRALRALAPGRPLLCAGRSATADVPLDLGAAEIVVPQGVDSIVHLAGEKRDASHMEAVNHRGTCRLLEAAARAGVRRFVLLSSVGVYGAPQHSGLVDVRHVRTPHNAYEVSKAAGEECVRRRAAQLGIEHVVVQPATVIDHVPGRSYPLLGLMAALRDRRFSYFGRADGWVNYIHVDDVAAAIGSALFSGRDGAAYIANTPARVPELVGWICNELGVESPTRRLPAWLGATAAAAGDALQRVCGRSMPFGTERYRELTNTTRYDGAAFFDELGLVYPLGIAQAVRFLVRAYRAEGRL